MDLISLHGIDVYAHHGVHPAERELGQRFLIDVDLEADCEEAQTRDDLSLAVDYAVVHDLVRATVREERCELIETVAANICRMLLTELATSRVTVKVEKPHPPIPGFRGTASVTLTRDRAWLDRGREVSP